MTLGLKSGRFYRNARLHCLNILLTYEDGCLGRCAYCGLSGERTVAEQDKNFIRVDWPTHSVDEILRRIAPPPIEIERICLSMVTRRHCVEDVKTISRRIRDAVDTPISFLVAPTLMSDDTMADEFRAFQDAGAGWIGVAVDAATPALFDKHRGGGVNGPHSWNKYWRAVETAANVFGEARAGVHLVTGLGESERQMVETVQRARDLGALTHLFSFFPEEGSALVEHERPSVGHYRRVQLARFLIDEKLARAEDMTFDAEDRISGFAVDARELDAIIDSGVPFRTSGCPGKSVVRVGEREYEIGACNRPYANCLPGPDIRNYPFQPDEKDVATIREQLLMYPDRVRENRSPPTGPATRHAPFRQSPENPSRVPCGDATARPA
jgi:biotin synthase